MHNQPVKQWRHKTMLTQAFEMFVEDEGRDDNPVAGLKLEPNKSPLKKSRNKKRAANPYFEDEPEPFSIQEMELYRRLERDHHFTIPEVGQRYRDYTGLLYDTAARPGEGLAVEFDDIDFDDCTVTLNATVVEVLVTSDEVKQLIELYELEDEEMVIRKDWKELPAEQQLTFIFRQPFPKTKSSMRKIKVGTERLAVLKRRRLAAPPGRKLVYASLRGNILRPWAMAKIYKEIVADSAIEASSLKTLRSTKATRVAEKHLRRGKDFAIARAREILGHEIGSPVTTDHYVAIEELPVIDFVGVR